MDYQKHYDNLIKTRKTRAVKDGVYYEKHHIIMKSMGGTNDPENIIRLTAREHFLAHWLLWQIHRNRSTAYAFYCMCVFKTNKQKRKISSSKAYQEIREVRSKELSIIMSNRIHTDASNQKRREWSLKQKHTDAAKQKISINNLKYVNDFKNRIKKYRDENGPTFSGHHTEHSKSLMREKLSGVKNPNAKKLYQYDQQRLIKIWDCVSDFVKYYKIPLHKISRNARHNSKTCKYKTIYKTNIMVSYKELYK